MNIKWVNICKICSKLILLSYFYLFIFVVVVVSLF